MRLWIPCALALALAAFVPVQSSRAAGVGHAAAHRAGLTRTSALAFVVIKGFAFNPASKTITHGTTVVWVNEDKVGHTVTADSGSFNSGVIMPGKFYVHTFSSAGTVSYHCAIHPFMKAKVIAT